MAELSIKNRCYIKTDPSTAPCTDTNTAFHTYNFLHNILCNQQTYAGVKAISYKFSSTWFLCNRNRMIFFKWSKIFALIQIH